MFFTVLFCILLVLFAAVLIMAEKRSPRQRILWKSLASLMFVAIGITAVVRGNMGPAGGFLFAGLIFAFIGDFFICLFDNSDLENTRTFTIGVGSFALAHICYIIFCIANGGWNAWALLLSILLAGLTMATVFLFKMKVDKVLIPVAVNASVLSFSFASAIVCAANAGGGRLWLMALGLLAFAVSDFILLFKYFAGKQSWPVTVANLSSYYLAQLLIALALVA